MEGDGAQIARQAVRVVRQVLGVVEQGGEDAGVNGAVIDGEVGEWAVADATAAGAGFHGDVLGREGGEGDWDDEIGMRDRFTVTGHAVRGAVE